MKKSVLGMIIFSFAIVVTWNAAFAQTEKGFSISRLVVCSGIEAREPVDVSDTFPALTEKVYCFLEATDVVEETQVAFVWYFGEKEMARITLPLKKSKRWRTYGSKNLAGLKGDWKIEVQDAQGNTVRTVSFKVE